MAGALANRLPAVPSSLVRRSGMVPALFLNEGRDGGRRGSNPGGRGLPSAGSEPRPQGVWYKSSDSLVLSSRVEVVSAFFYVRWLFFVFVDVQDSDRRATEVKEATEST